MVTPGKKNGTITFICNASPGVRRVYLVGDFNQWNVKHKRMVKSKNGSFHAKVQLPPGQYQYKFLADGTWLHDANARSQVMNPYGTLNSVINVV